MTESLSNETRAREVLQEAFGRPLQWCLPDQTVEVAIAAMLRFAELSASPQTDAAAMQHNQIATDLRDRAALSQGESA